MEEDFEADDDSDSLEADQDEVRQLISALQDEELSDTVPLPPICISFILN